MGEFLASVDAYLIETLGVGWLWITIGFTGQALFSARFLVQWFHSEKHGKSLIPLAFWYFSIGGGLVLLSYAIHREDPVFIAGQAGGLIVYVRNLMLISKDKKRMLADEGKDS